MPFHGTGTGAARRGPVQLDPILSIVIPQDHRPRARWLPCTLFPAQLLGSFCERLDALQISLMHWEGGARPASAATMVTGLS